ncbi:MAG TPA: ABC transporter ATP-binding protein [Candidatus Eremiobacteraeota bacterium]|nr:MAG: Galactose/methyl galactoside import ATP-binding protein MglA [bacterium ADurb.Bin363]HPZ09247.1 ABC transporter ATP-binding protein [Candidatus Eremiobacteraeota bacterium]
MKVVEMMGITKEFPGIKANENVSFHLNKGEILALVGENGAGKSTLMNILYGLYQPESGEIYIQEKPVVIKDPNTAISLGIGMVHQHFMLIPPLTVTENIILGSEPVDGGIFINIDKASRKVKDISEQYGLKIDPFARIESISVGMQQRVEILKTLYRGAEILILDEPTAVLTPQEIKELFTIMRVLIEKGKSIIIITHKLDEVKEISDRIVVLRHGKIMGEALTSEVSTSQIASMMVGRDVVFRIKKETIEPGEVVLDVHNVTACDDRGLPALQGITFNVRAGEIVGIAGVDGNGQTELVEAITGLRSVKSGKISLKGKEITNLPPRKIIETGLGHIPEDRHKRGLVLNFSVAENFVLMEYYKSPFAKWINLSYRAINDFAQKLIGRFDVRTPGKETLVRSLSGGNQQKIIIAREIVRNPNILIASQPTRGLDVGAIEFVQENLLEQRRNGKAILLVSLELEEIMNLSDRILVIYEGSIVGEVSGEEATRDKIGIMMTGVKGEEEKGEKCVGAETVLPFVQNDEL